ncbi:MAG: phenylalanine--tRNA ligase subunit beta [Spirochaetes bacterium]|nr:phenylalanine--tRNA ligase subunit beta [Spirochaetota bacterium]
MPKIEVNETLFFSLVGRRYDAAELEKLLPVAKAELDEWNRDEGNEDDRVIKIELNDTNRPDLWSTAGLARALRIYSGDPVPDYPFFSRDGDQREAVFRIVVDASVRKPRPYIAAFVVSGKPITDAMLKDVIQTQEKLAWNFGRKRRTISMGVYRIALIKWPVVYKAVTPDSVSFVPLQSDRSMTLSEILREHPKGREYAFILENEPEHPLLVDSTGAVLSYPPIINSNDLGAVKVGDSDLLVELTGTDLPSVTLAASIIACNFADAGYCIKPIAVDYPFDTDYGRRVVNPHYFQAPVSIDANRIGKLLGKPFTPEKARECLARMGVRSDQHGVFVSASPPEYRNDFLHPVDVVEDVMIGFGMENFEPERPHDFTIGRLTPIELLSRKVKGLLVGMGYQEMIYNYLGSGRDYIERMNVPGDDTIRISNPMSENFEYVRPSILPSLLMSEAVSAKAPYPHRIFEVGKVAYRDVSANYGTTTRQKLGFLASHANADFNEAASHAAALLYYLGEDNAVGDSEDPRFIPGRQAAVLRNGSPIGVFGEMHPRVLDNWGVTMPCIAGEIDIETLLPGASSR